MSRPCVRKLSTLERVLLNTIHHLDLAHHDENIEFRPMSRELLLDGDAGLRLGQLALLFIEAKDANLRDFLRGDAR